MAYMPPYYIIGRMEQNEELKLAWDFVENTGISIFLTGKAGTGKTTFLKAVQQHSPKRMIVVAPTGVAAINAGGMTIHSFFQLPLSPYVPETTFRQRYDFSKEKKKIIRTLDLLVIDEISMVRSDLLDAIDSVMRRFKDARKPFGGAQLLMIGDLQQLTPVVTPADEEILSRYYDTPYFFGSKALQRTRYVTLELKQVYRQQDPVFLNILNHIREGQPTAEDVSALNGRCHPDFVPKAEDGFIRLTTHNRLADSYNESRLRKLATKEFQFDARIEGTFPEYSYPTDVTLTLKEGAQVMFVKNDPDGAYYNGRIGRVTHISRSNIWVQCQGEDEEIDVQPQIWENAKYELDDETKEIKTNIQGTFVQYPLRLAWAITIHKSQGLTFERAIIDANLSFAAGQVYVALSRCKTLQGMVLASPIRPATIFGDRRVSDYIAREEEEAARSIAELPLLKDRYHVEHLKELFDFSDIDRKESHLLRILEEHFYRHYPRLAAAHKEARKELADKIIEVSRKWTMVFVQMNSEQLCEKGFVERVNRSTVYFLNALTDILGSLLEQTMVESDNQILRKRFQEALADLHLSYGIKTAVLRQIAKEGFNPATYLARKQKAVLMATDDGAPKKAKKKKTAKADVGKVAVVANDIPHPELFNLLREWRARKSGELGIPAYAIMQQKALFGMVNNLPTDIPSLIAIPYFGKRSAERYGEEILRIIGRFVEDSGVERPEVPTKAGIKRGGKQ